MEEMITIELNRYKELLRSEMELDALWDFGVDDWDKYQEAMDSIYKNQGQTDET